MRNLVLTFLLLIPALSGSSQFFERNMTMELRYPIPAGKNFMNDNALGGNGYIGIIDAGFEYNIYQLKNLGLGIAFNASVLRLPETDLTTAAYIPKIRIDYDLRLGSISIIPQAGLGFSHWRFKAPDAGEIENKKSENGITYEGSLKLVLRNSDPVNWFLQFAYEFTRLEKPSHGEIDSDFNRNINMLYPGLGLIWKF